MIRKMRDGFPKLVVVVLTLLFIVGLAVTLSWFFYSGWYIAVHGSGSVVGGLGILAAMRISALLSVWVALTSALLWFHHKQEASYTTPLEFLFGICFGFFLFILVLSGAAGGSTMNMRKPAGGERPRRRTANSWQRSSRSCWGPSP